MLAGYIDYVSEAVVNKVIQYARDQLIIKTQFETQKLAQDRVKIRNQLDAKIQRLGYSLEIASAAGIVKPLYSNGQAVRDDPRLSCCGGLLQHGLNSGNRSLWQKDMSGSVRLQRHEKV